MLTTPGDQQEDHERDQVLALLDGELVERRREVPVGEQEARDRAHERGDEAAERRDHHHDEHEHEQVARQREPVTELGEDQRQHRRRGDGERPRQRAPARGDRDPVAGARGRVSARERWSSPVDEITCTSIGPEARITLLITEPRMQVGPPRLTAGAEHDLGRVLGLGELHERRRDVGAREHAVLAAQLVEQPPLLFERVAGRRAQPVGRAHVDADELAVRARRHARRRGG